VGQRDEHVTARRRRSRLMPVSLPVNLPAFRRNGDDPLHAEIVGRFGLNEGSKHKDKSLLVTPISMHYPDLRFGE
jgi:hypothetical protein